MLGLPGGGYTADGGSLLLAVALASGAVRPHLAAMSKGRREPRDPLETVFDGRRADQRRRGSL
jgi:hypothetical protein